jgi:hypothetical protein
VATKQKAAPNTPEPIKVVIRRKKFTVTLTQKKAASYDPPLNLSEAVSVTTTLPYVDGDPVETAKLYKTGLKSIVDGFLANTVVLFQGSGRKAIYDALIVDEGADYRGALLAHIEGREQLGRTAQVSKKEQLKARVSSKIKARKLDPAVEAIILADALAAIDES